MAPKKKIDSKDAKAGVTLQHFFGKPQVQVVDIEVQEPEVVELKPNDAEKVVELTVSEGNDSREIQTLKETEVPSHNSDEVIVEVAQQIPIHPLFAKRVREPPRNVVSCDSPITVDAPVNTPDSRNATSSIERCTGSEFGDEPSCMESRSCIPKLDVNDTENNTSVAVSPAISDEMIVEESRDVEIQEILEDTSRHLEEVSASSAASSGRPMRQAKLNTIAKQQEQKAITATLDRVIRTGGRLRPDAADHSVSSKRKRDNTRGEEDGDGEDEDFVFQSTKSRIKGAPVASFFMTKEERAKRKAEELEELRRRKAEEEAMLKKQREAEAEAARQALAAERELRIRQQFRENRMKNQNSLQDAFGTGVNKFFTQTFASKETGTLNAGAIVVENVGDGDNAVTLQEWLLQFPPWQHVGAPYIESLPPSADFSPFSRYRDSSADRSNLSAAQTMDFLSGCLPQRNAIISVPRSQVAFCMRSLFVEYFSSEVRRRLARLPQIVDDSPALVCADQGFQFVDLTDNNDCTAVSPRGTVVSRCNSASSLASTNSCQSITSLNRCWVSSQYSQETFVQHFTDSGINRQPTKKILKWMEIWAGKRRRKPKSESGSRRSNRSRQDRQYQEDDDKSAQYWDERGNRKYGSNTEIEKDELAITGDSNILVVIGPSGSGKTASIYACAKAAGYNVIEVGACHERKGADVRKLVSEAAQSHGLGLSTNNSTAVGADDGNSFFAKRQSSAKDKDVSAAPAVAKMELNLILFDEADIVFEDDNSLYTTIVQLARTSKCPIVLTTETELPFVRSLNPLVVRFHAPTWTNTITTVTHCLEDMLSSTCKHLNLNAFQQNPSISVSSLLNMELRLWSANCAKTLVFLCGGELRAALQCIQLLTPAVVMSNLTHQPDSSRCNNRDKLPIRTLTVGSPETFSTWLSLEGVDFHEAVKLYATKFISSPIPASRLSVPKASYLVVAPLISRISPQKGPVHGGFFITISGKHLLQRITPASNYLNLKVYIGSVECPSVLLSDTEISCLVPIKTFTTAGVLPVEVVLSTQMGTSAAQKEVIITSSITGRGNSWLQLCSTFDASGLASQVRAMEMSSGRRCWSKKAVSRQAFLSDDSESDVEEPPSVNGIQEVDKTKVDSDIEDFEELPVGLKRKPLPRFVSTGRSQGLNIVKTKAGTETSAKQHIMSKRSLAKSSIDSDNESKSDDPASGCIENKSEIPRSLIETFDTSTIPSSDKLLVDSAGNGSFKAVHVLLREIVARLSQIPSSEVFFKPVLPDEAPDYAMVVAKPMDLGTIASSLEERLYLISVPANGLGVDLAGFVADVRLVWSNCAEYNGESSQLTQLANYLAKEFETLLFNGIQDLLNQIHSCIQNRLQIIGNQILFDGACIFQGKIVAGPQQLFTASSLPVADTASLWKSLIEAEGTRLSMDMFNCTQKNWRADYIFDGLEYSDEDSSPVWLYPTSEVDELMGEDVSTLAIHDYFRMLDEHCDADILDTRVKRLTDSYSACAEIDIDCEDQYNDSEELNVLGPRVIYLAEVLRGLSYSGFANTVEEHCSSSSHGPNSSTNSWRGYNESIYDLFVSESSPVSMSTCEEPLPMESEDIQNSSDEDNFTGNFRKRKFKSRQQIKTSCLEKDEIRTKKRFVSSDSDVEETLEFEDQSSSDSGSESEEDAKLRVARCVSSQEDDNCRYPAVTTSRVTTLLPRNEISSFCMEEFQKYIRAVLCGAGGPFARSTVGTSYFRCMVLDYVPMLARMVQAEAIDDSARTLGLSDCVGQRRSRRRGPDQSRFSYTSSATQLPQTQLEKLLEYGFIGAMRCDEGPIGSGRNVLCLGEVPWA